MADQQLSAVRRRLEQERERLRAEIDAFFIENAPEDDDYGSGHHPGDDASELFLRERNLVLHSRIQDQITEVEAALERLEQGEYGTCARCGRPISEERLLIRPEARYCIDCQALLEP